MNFKKFVVKHFQKRCGDCNEYIGQGFFANVYQSSKPEFAIKRAHSPKINDYFIRECAILRYLHHPNIINLIGINIRKSLLICIPFADCTLNSLDLSDIKIRQSIVFQLLSGLAHCHSLDIWHLDIKPDNILVFNINDPVIKITDFGSAQPFMQPSSSNNTDIITIPWRAPELFTGDFLYSEKVDIWSVGVILLNAITDNAFYNVLKSAGVEARQKIISDLPYAIDNYIIDNVTDNVLDNVTDNVDPDEYTLLCSLLSFADTRVSALEALEFHYFNGIYKKPIQHKTVRFKPIAYDIMWSQNGLREKFVHWLYNNTKNVKPNTFFLGLLLLDTFLQKVIIAEYALKKYGVAAQYISSCLYEYWPQAVLDNSQFSTNDINNSIKHILTVLDFKILQKSCYEYIHKPNEKIVDILLNIVCTHYSRTPKEQAYMAMQKAVQ